MIPGLCDCTDCPSARYDKYARDVRQAEEHAKAAQTRADWAASYAVTVAEMAWLAALDADVARREADALKRQ
jgi:hypothetical protein